MRNALIVIPAVFFLGMACVTLVAPNVVPRHFGMALRDGGDTGRAEVRAVYGGFGLAMAAMLTLALLDDSVRRGVVWTVAAALAGMALGRVLSALLGDRTRFYPNWFYFTVEAIAAAALFTAA